MEASLDISLSSSVNQKMNQTCALRMQTAKL